MRRFSTRSWVAAGAVLAVIVALAALAALSPDPKDDVLGVEYERSSTTSPVTTGPAAVEPTSTTSGPVAARAPSPPAGSSPAPSGARTGSIAGTVTRGGAPLAGARVTLMLAGGERTTVTGPDGGYSLNDVPAGRHQLQVVTPGSEPSCDDAGNCLGGPSQTANRQVEVIAGRQSRVDVSFS